MRRLRLAILFGCTVGAPVAATAQPAQRPPLAAPELTIHPQGALPIFGGEAVDVTIGWRPVPGAARYRVLVVDAAGRATELATSELRLVVPGLAAGGHRVTVSAIDRNGVSGAESDVLPLNVIEVRALPPGSDRPQPPTRGAYAVGTRFAVTGMHCEFGDAPLDDLLVGPENEASIPMAGLALLRCAGQLGYLEKHVVIAPVSVVAESRPIARGTTTRLALTLSSVAALGEQLAVEGNGDVSVDGVERTPHGLDVTITVPRGAHRAGLAVRASGVELGRVELALVAGAAPTAARSAEPELPPIDLAAFDLGGHVGLFAPPDGRKTPTLGNPTNAGDAITSGPVLGLHLGFFPVPRIGIEGMASLITAGYADQAAGYAQILSLRGQLAVRVVESGTIGLRLFAGSGTLTTLEARNTSRRVTETAFHAGAAFTVETAPNLWLRLHLADVVITARDGGYAHCAELGLALITRLGRRDAW